MSNPKLNDRRLTDMFAALPFSFEVNSRVKEALRTLWYEDLDFVLLVGSGKPSYKTTALYAVQDQQLAKNHWLALTITLYDSMLKLLHLQGISAPDFAVLRRRIKSNS